MLRLTYCLVKYSSAPQEDFSHWSVTESGNKLYPLSSSRFCRLFCVSTDLFSKSQTSASTALLEPDFILYLQDSSQHTARWEERFSFITLQLHYRSTTGLSSWSTLVFSVIRSCVLSCQFYADITRIPKLRTISQTAFVISHPWCRLIFNITKLIYTLI